MIPIKKKKHLENIRRKEDDDYESGPVNHSREQQGEKKLSLPVLDNKEDNHDENRN